MFSTFSRNGLPPRQPPSSMQSQTHFSDPPQILPLKLSDTRPPSTSRIPKRCCRLLVFLFLSFSALVWLYTQRPGEDSPSSEVDAPHHSLPPLYEAYHDYERRLPQHNLSLPFPEGRDAKFFWAPNHVTGEHPFCLLIWATGLNLSQPRDGETPCRNSSSTPSLHTRQIERE